jgi:hypothetical protein
MSQTPFVGGEQEAGMYEFRLRGHLDQRWATRLEVSSLSHEIDGTTALRVTVVDQAALHGLLQRIRDLGLPIISVVPLDPANKNHSTIDPDSRETHPQKRNPT